MCVSCDCKDSKNYVIQNRCGTEYSGYLVFSLNLYRMGVGDLNLGAVGLPAGL
jgi:hypothetical protein